MARTTKQRWSYLSGEKGRNRVRAYERASGALMIEFRDRGRRRRIALDHRDRDQAKRQADAAAAGIAKAEVPVPERPKERTLGELFEMYLGEVTPTKATNTQKHDRRTTEMLSRYFGASRTVVTLSVRDRDRFVRDRRAGRIAPAGSRAGTSVGDRVIEQDLRLLNAVFNWATMAGDGGGGVLLERNPFKGYKLPKEKNPRRVVLTDDEYTALRAVAVDVDWRFYVALVIAHETGHRIGAISELRWSDIDLDGEEITWRAENEKTGYRHQTPMTRAASEALEFARSRNPGIGDAPVFPAPKDAARGMSRHLARDWWKKAEVLAQLDPKRGRGWHSLRRKFASDLMHVPLKTLCELGGWKSHQTVLSCYQHPDQKQLRDALLDRRSAASGD